MIIILLDSIFRHHNLIDDDDHDNWTMKLEVAARSLFKNNVNTDTSNKGIISSNNSTTTRTIREGDFSKLRTFFD